MYLGVFIFFNGPDENGENSERFNLITTPKVEDNKPTRRLELDTIIFHTFILMNLFNQINCRIVDSDELSDWRIWRGLHGHYQFLMVIGGEFAMQHIMVTWFSHSVLTAQLFNVAPFSKPWIAPVCWTLGVLSLAVNFIVKNVPIRLFDNINDSINLEIQNPEEWINVLM